uniref:HELP domain-containing protein n=1 Tax=Macrostomum lignano TaxID=282301 RepID=A0A1I8FD07_9PLAT
PPTAPKDALVLRITLTELCSAGHRLSTRAVGTTHRYVVECVDCGGARLVYEPASSLTDRAGHGSRPAARDGLHLSNICSERRSEVAMATKLAWKSVSLPNWGGYCQQAELNHADEYLLTGLTQGVTYIF